MAKYYSLFGGTTTDTEIQVAKENQIVIYEGPGATRDQLVIYRVEHSADGYMYHLVNVETKDIRRTDILTPLSKKFGIGMYYTDTPPEFMDVFEVAILVAEAEQKAKDEAEAKARAKAEHDRIATIGAERLECLMPAGGHRGRTQQDGIHRPVLRMPQNDQRPHSNTRFFDHLPQRLRGTAQSRRQSARNGASVRL